MKAKYIGITRGGQGVKDRWECPKCRDEKMPECRMTLSKKKRGKIYPCRFCKTELELKI